MKFLKLPNILMYLLKLNNYVYLMLNELCILQFFTFIVLFYFVSTFNIITLWYLSGLYLILLGILLLLDDGDIFIGFLWVIDLGVGLVFFIFILHYSTFLYQKSSLEKSSRESTLLLFFIFFILSFFFFFITPTDSSFTDGFSKTWFLFISWYDYYDFFFSNTVTDLNLLREIFFYTDSFEFYVINFMLLFGIISSILLCFLIKRIFNYLNLPQLLNLEFLTKINTSYLIRNQNFLKQQSTSTGTRVWMKKKHMKF